MLKVVIRKLSILPFLIGKIKFVHSGLAFAPCSIEASEAILNARKVLFILGAKPESAINKTPVIIPAVPSSIGQEQECIELSSSMFADEAERICSLQPAHINLFKRNHAEDLHRNWTAFLQCPFRHA